MYVKRNSDCAVFTAENKMGFTTCLWNPSRKFVVAHTSWTRYSATVPEGEAQAVLISLRLALSMGCLKCSESDSRTIVVAINDLRVYVNELGSLIEKCRDILFSQENFHFQLVFLQRQVNRVVHNLARAFVLESGLAPCLLFCLIMYCLYYSW